VAGVTVLRVFDIKHNALAALEQNYELAKAHYAEVCQHRNPCNPEHQRRFRDAHERVEVARVAYLKAVVRQS
jgi:hypothetical protein